MDKSAYLDAIRDQTERALWSVGNVADCIPNHLWDREYCGMPLWKHVYHTLHSLDRWMINPSRYEEPPFHTPDLDNLDVSSGGRLDREQLREYFQAVETKIRAYLEELEESHLLQMPAGCSFDRFTLILAQHRHLHAHMGMLMGILIAEEGVWPRVLGLMDEIPREPGNGSLF